MKARVVHIITKLELGGAQQNTLWTVRHLDRRSFEPYLITNDQGLLVQQAKAIEGLGLYLLPELVREVDPRRDLAALRKITSILKELKGRGGPMIVHTHSSKAGILGRWAGWLAGAEGIIHSIHGFGFNDYQPWPVRRFFIALEKATARITHRFIAVSEANIKKGVRLGLFPPEKAVLIRSGIEVTRFASVKVDPRRKRRELGLREDLPLVTMIACLKPQKAPLDFVRVAQGVLKEVEASFVLVGDGLLRPKVLEAARRAGIDGSFHLLGWRWDVEEILAATDVFVLTSLWEGLPRVIPQAMAAGVPVVATAVDGTPEAVRHGVNGFLVRPRAPEEAARYVTSLLKDPEKARKMGQEGQKTAWEFDVGDMVKRQEELYKDLLSAARP